MTTTIITCIISWAVSFVLGIEYHDKYTERGFCPIYAKEADRRSYEAYHALGGNGVITKLYNDIMALPEEDPASKKERRT